MTASPRSPPSSATSARLDDPARRAGSGIGAELPRRGVALQPLRSRARAIEHIDSTAVPGLVAKPIIGILATLDTLDTLTPDLPALNRHGHAVIDAGMVNRVFPQRPGFNLQIVTPDSWPRGKERPMHDALIMDRVHDRTGWPRFDLWED
jgi:GrpB protein